jgi:hypothetical protein
LENPNALADIEVVIPFLGLRVQLRMRSPCAVVGRLY